MKRIVNYLNNLGTFGKIVVFLFLVPIVSTICIAIGYMFLILTFQYLINLY